MQRIFHREHVNIKFQTQLNNDFRGNVCLSLLWREEKGRVSSPSRVTSIPIIKWNCMISNEFFIS